MASALSTIQMAGIDYVTERNGDIVTVGYDAGLTVMANEFYNEHQKIMESITFYDDDTT